MKNSITISFICGALLIAGSVNAQIDQDRMDKDIRVAANVLQMLTQGDSRFMMYGDNVDGNYIEGYGVIFSAGGGHSIFTGSSARVYSFSPKFGNIRTLSGAVVSPSPQPKKNDQPVGEETKDLEMVIIEFLTNYSQLISQLKPTDKIVVSTKKSDYIYVSTNREDVVEGAGSQGITAELLKKDHNDYISGKISNKQLLAKIKVSKISGDEGRSKDLDLFGSMLKTIYNDSYTDSYFITWEPNYERLNGVGAIYSFKVYSSYDEAGGYRMPAINEKGLNSTQRNEKVVSLYPVFIKSMKENIIQYGRTISSLEQNEMLLLKITLTKCDDCSIPKKIQFSVKQSVLANFNSGKISQKDAIAKVVMSEL